MTAPTVKTDDDNGQAILREIELTGRVRTSPLILRRSTADDNLNNSSNYVITKPYFRAANSSSAVVTALGTYTSVTASGVEKPYPTAEDLKRYGLDDPYSTAVFTLAVETTETSETSGESAKTSITISKKHTIQLGNKNDNGEYYALVYNEDQRIPWSTFSRLPPWPGRKPGMTMSRRHCCSCATSILCPTSSSRRAAGRPTLLSSTSRMHPRRTIR